MRTERIMSDARVEKDASTQKKKKEKKREEPTTKIPVHSLEKRKGKKKMTDSPLRMAKGKRKQSKKYLSSQRKGEGDRCITEEE